MMLIQGTEHPVTFHKDDQMVQVTSMYDQEPFDVWKLQPDFAIDMHEKKQVYKMALREWDEYPHFAVAYYDQQEEILTVSALTDHGFGTLAQHLQKYELDVSEMPDTRVNPAMLFTAKKILKKPIELLPDEKLFDKPVSDTQTAETDKINEMLQLILPDMNAGRAPNIEAAAKKTGVDPEVAKQVIGQIMDKYGKMKR